MDSNIINFGFINIKWYSILIAISIFLGIFIVEKETEKFELNKDILYNLIFGVVISGIIGARLYYVIFNINYYSKNIVEIFAIWNGGLAIHGSIIGGILYTIYYTRKNKLNTIHIIDLFIPALLLGQVIGRWGNFFNKEAHGGITTLEFLNSIHLPNFIIDGMNINGNYYHPTFLYESIWNFFGLIIVIFIIRKLKNLKIGDITGFYLIWYSFARFIIESMRTDSLMFLNFKVAQIISITLFIIGIILISKIELKKIVCYIIK